jgi:hypothetical protein
MATQPIAKPIVFLFIRTPRPYESYPKLILHARVLEDASVLAQKREKSSAFWV